MHVDDGADVQTRVVETPPIDLDAPDARKLLEATYPREESDDSIPAPDGSDAEKWMAVWLQADAEISRLELVKERAGNRLRAAIKAHGGIIGERAMASWRTVSGRVNWPALVGTLKVPAKRLEALKEKFRGAGHRELRVRPRA